MTGYLRLLPLAKLGEHSIAMVDEEVTGEPYFVEGSSADLGDPPLARIQVDVDLPLRAVVRAAPDFLMTTGGIPLLSDRFRAAIETAAPHSMSLTPATLRFAGGDLEFSAARAPYLRLIDPDHSTFSQLGPIRILTGPAFVAADEPFLLARDRDYPDFLVGSPRLAALVREHALNLTLLPY